MFDVSEPKTEEYALELIGYINNIYMGLGKFVFLGKITFAKF